MAFAAHNCTTVSCTTVHSPCATILANHLFQALSMDASREAPSSRSSSGPRTEVACTNCRSVKKKCEQDRDPNKPCLRCSKRAIECIRSVPSLQPLDTNATDPNTRYYSLIQALDPPEDPYRNSQAFQQSAPLSGPVNGQEPVKTTTAPSAMGSSLPSNNTSSYMQVPQSDIQTAPRQQMSTAQYDEQPGASTSNGAFDFDLGRGEIPNMSSPTPVNDIGYKYGHGNIGTS